MIGIIFKMKKQIPKRMILDEQRNSKNKTLRIFIEEDLIENLKKVNVIKIIIKKGGIKK